jgi:L-amino acid N-acyltransferase YncA
MLLVTLRDATQEDLPILLSIHNHAVEHLTAAWTTKKDTLEERAAWLAEHEDAGLPVIVAEDDYGNVIGYGTYKPFRHREGYRLTVEHSLYVVESAQGSGVGRAILERLVQLARRDGYHVLVGAVDGENTASIALHKKLGFEVTGRLPQVGMKFGRWLDLALVTLILDDRPAPPEN